MSVEPQEDTPEDWGVDLTLAARAGGLSPMIGRETILDRVLLVLARKTKNNPVLLGHPGVGKTAIAEGLAARLISGAVPRRLRGWRLYSLNLGSLLAGTGYRGDFELRLRRLIRELSRPEIPRMLFIDEIHLLSRAGRSEGGLDAANLLKPLLARGGLPCLGATTPAEWQMLIEEDPALERRFQPIEVPPASPAETRTILYGLRDCYAAYHEIRISDAALEAAVAEAERMPQGRLMPDRAIDILDEACARLGMATHGQSAKNAAERLRGPSLQEALERFDLDAVARLLHPNRNRTCDTRPLLLAEHVTGRS